MIFIGFFSGEVVVASADGITHKLASNKVKNLTQFLVIKTNVRITNSLLLFLTLRVLNFQRGVLKLNLFIHG